MSPEKIPIIGVIPRYPKHSQHNIYAKIRMPPIGLPSVLSQVSHDPRFEGLYAIDENNYCGPRDDEGMPDHNFLQRTKPAKIAMFYGGMSNSVLRLYSLARKYQGYGSVTMAGGHHVDALPEEALRSGIDIVVHKEGELTTKEVLDTMAKDGIARLDRKELYAVKGISFLDDGKHVFTGDRGTIKDLDSLVDVDLTLIKHLRKRWSAIPVGMGRGCNQDCEFCSVNTPYHSSSVDKALRQVEKFSDLRYKHFFFVDDNFAQNPKKTIELCKAIGDYKRTFGKKFDMMVQVRSEVAKNDELLSAMRFAGVRTLAIGYESPINEELKAMNKGVTMEQLVERSRKLSENFCLHGMFIFGYPDKDYKSNLTLEEMAMRYKRFFKEARIDTLQVLNAIPIPGSDLRDRLEREKRILPRDIVDWDRYDGQFLCYNPEPADPFKLQELPRSLMKKYYLGNVLNHRLNRVKWMNWTYTAITFPVQFGFSYTRRFFHNLKDNAAENIFREPLVDTWSDIKRRWRNLFIRTSGRGIVKEWLKDYHDSDYRSKFRDYFSKKQ